MMDPSALAPMSGPTGAMSAPTADPGSMANSISQIGAAVQMLTQALQGLPMGDDTQKAVIDAIQKLSKIAPPSAQVPGVQVTQLQGLAQAAQQDQMMQAVLRSLANAHAAPGGPSPQDQPQPGPQAGPMM